VVFLDERRVVGHGASVTRSSELSLAGQPRRLLPVVTAVAIAAWLAVGLATGKAGAPHRGGAIGTPSTRVREVARAAKGKPLLVVLGDSVAAGTACSCGGFGGSLARVDGSAALRNAAAEGQTSAGLLAQLDDPAILSSLRAATMVTVTVGANDFDESLAGTPDCGDLHCYAATMTGTDSTLGAIATRLRSSTPAGTTIVFTGYWNVFLDGRVGADRGPGYVAASDALTRQFNALVARVATDAGDAYADLYTPFKAYGSRDDTALLAPDGDHPDAAGQHLIAAAVARAVGLPDPS